MNNEIKEILDFKENADYKKLSCDEIKVLRDYITNLQQENERLKEENKDNEQLIETQLRGLEKQKQIIDKAIEYLKGNACYIESNIFVDDLCCYECMELLNILNGRGDE